MKTFLRIQLILLVLISLGCGEDDLEVPNLTGEWFYRSDRTQFLDFSQPELINVNGNPFTFEILENNELELSYSGPIFILLPTTKHKVTYADDGTVLLFTNLENLHFFNYEPGEEGFER